MNLALEAVGVLAGGDADYAQEGAAHGVGSLEAAGIGDLFQAHCGAVDHLLGGFDAHAVYELSGVHSRFAKADAGEVTGAHAYSLREAVNGEVVAQVFEHPYLQLAKGLRCDGLMGEHVVVLGLASGADEEHDELSRYCQCCLVAVIFLYKCKREIDAGSDACRGVGGAVAEEDWGRA